MIQAVPAQRAALHARKRRQYWLYSTAAAAILLLAGGAALERFGSDEKQAAMSPQEPRQATLIGGSLRSETGAKLSGGVRFGGTATLETPAEEAALLVTQAGVLVDLGPVSKARLRSARKQTQIDLMRGRVALDVPPLASDATLQVKTPDTTVTVRGTRFTVSYDATKANQRTCVRVTEGEVSVDSRAGTRSLVSGHSFGCDEAESIAKPGQPAVERPTEQPIRREGARPRTRSGMPQREPASAHGTATFESTLEKENRMLERALSAEKVGDLETAKFVLDALLTGYPDSPIANEAKAVLERVERKRRQSR
jgi:hypothetical protein